MKLSVSWRDFGKLGKLSLNGGIYFFTYLGDEKEESMKWKITFCALVGGAVLAVEEQESCSNYYKMNLKK